MDNAQKLLLLKRIHLHLIKGGLGITGAAFIGSFILSFNPCPRFKKPLGSRKLKALYTVQSAKDICPQLQQISLDTTKTQQYHSIRRLISNAVQAHIEQEVDRSVTTGCAAGGGDMFYANMNQWQQEQSIQHMANKVPSTMLFY